MKRAALFGRRKNLTLNMCPDFGQKSAK